MSQCCICKQPIPRKVGGFYTTYRSRRRTVLFRRWCRKCDEQRPAEVESLIAEVARLDERNRAA
jgi:hypothetical protein